MEDHYIRDNGESHHIGDHHSNPKKIQTDRKEMYHYDVIVALLYFLGLRRSIRYSIQQTFIFLGVVIINYIIYLSKALFKSSSSGLEVTMARSQFFDG